MAFEGKTTNEAQLERLRRITEGVVDGLGRPIDEQIKETVVFFNAFGLRTTGSCEGGEPEEHGSLVPWIDVAPKHPDAPRWWEDEDVRKEVVLKLNELKLKAINLLEGFYRERKVSYDAMLGLKGVGYGFRIQSIGAETIKNVPEAVRPEKTVAYKKEMGDFTEFLKQKYQEE